MQYDEKENVIGLAFNCYNDSKMIAIRKKNIDKIDIFYTDNLKSDQAVVDFAEKTFLARK
jgi:hypothetical protein